MSTRGKRAQGKAAFLFAWGFKALKRFDLCPTFSQLIPHVFDSQSKPALARCSLSPLLRLPTIPCPETTTYCLSGRFPPRLYPPRCPEALQRPCVYFTIVDEWKYICQTLHFPVCSPRVAPSAKFGRSLSAVEVFVLVGKDLATRFLEKKKKRWGQALKKKNTPSRMPWMIKHAVKNKDAIKD